MFDSWNFGNIFQSNPFRQLERIIQLRPAETVLTAIGSGVVSLGLYVATGYTSSAAISALMYTTCAVSLSSTALFVSEYYRFLPIKWHVKDSELEPGECKSDDGRIIAKIELHDGLPVLRLLTDEPFEQGVALARSMPNQVMQAWDRYYALLQPALAIFHHAQVFISRFSRSPRDTERYRGGAEQYVRDLLERVRFNFPEEYLERIRGFVSEINIHIRQDNEKYVLQKSLLTEEDIKRLILTPDIWKMLACSAHIKKTSGGGKILGRTLDWEGFGHVAQHTIGVIYPTGHDESSGKPTSFFSVTFVPGFATISASNGHISMTMNEATTQETKVHMSGGYSQLVLFQMIMENCTSVEEVELFISNNTPATSCIFTVMGPSSGAVFQILPNDGSDRAFSKRELKDDEDYLHVTNHFFHDTGEIISGSGSWPDTERRFEVQRQALTEDIPHEERLRRLSQPVTVHAMIFRHRPRRGSASEIRISDARRDAARQEVILSLNVAHRYAGSLGTRYKEVPVSLALSTHEEEMCAMRRGGEEEQGAKALVLRPDSPSAITSRGLGLS